MSHTVLWKQKPHTRLEMTSKMSTEWWLTSALPDSVTIVGTGYSLLSCRRSEQRTQCHWHSPACKMGHLSLAHGHPQSLHFHCSSVTALRSCLDSQQRVGTSPKRHPRCVYVMKTLVLSCQMVPNTIFTKILEEQFCQEATLYGLAMSTSCLQTVYQYRPEY